MGYKPNGRGQGWANGMVSPVCRNGHPKGPGYCPECRREKNARYYERMRAGITRPRNMTDAHLWDARKAWIQTEKMSYEGIE